MEKMIKENWLAPEYISLWHNPAIKINQALPNAW
jgi:hypothetical protein